MTRVDSREKDTKDAKRRDETTDFTDVTDKQIRRKWGNNYRRMFYLFNIRVIREIRGRLCLPLLASLVPFCGNEFWPVLQVVLAGRMWRKWRSGKNLTLGGGVLTIEVA
jgi:hypothetical protein